ncbi:hypothetical protein D9M72_458000 [compost metagenome]
MTILILRNTDQMVGEEAGEAPFDRAVDQATGAAECRVEGPEGVRGIDTRNMGAGQPQPRQRAGLRTVAVDHVEVAAANEAVQFKKAADIRRSRRALHIDGVDGRQADCLQFAHETFLGAHWRINCLHMVPALVHAAAEVEEVSARAAAARLQHLEQAQGKGRAPARNDVFHDQELQPARACRRWRYSRAAHPQMMPRSR